MKSSLALLALCGAFASIAAVAAPAQQPVNAQPYEYGMPLDVAKVISITPASNDADCQVGTAHMVYVDHQGQTHEIAYQQMGNCSQL
ncbi:DUF2790 domain-containing protein [Pseudomonas entomophila]|uniref:DUF2790 domain-containing protein n=1 Tax=Pseudomonas entomophila TaxID=312306 RepID=UPI0023D7C2EB|nr:DUF2790 domain-containing protein [Pseudomonas entomophila]MDF0732927.1 DUF2790 domain-containing protein [Pseudomonas entomophila]